MYTTELIHKSVFDLTVSYDRNWSVFGEIDIPDHSNVLFLNSSRLLSFFASRISNHNKIIVLDENRNSYHQLRLLGIRNLEVIRNDIQSLDHVLSHFEIDQLNLIVSNHNFRRYTRKDRQKLIKNCYRWMSDESTFIQHGYLSLGTKRLFKNTFDQVNSKLVWDMSILPMHYLLASKHTNQ